MNLMKILELLVAGKHAGPPPPVSGGVDSDPRCEDVAVVTEHFAAVLDGATDPNGPRYGVVSGGRLAAVAAAAAIAELAPDVDAHTAVEQISAAVDAAIRAHVPDGAVTHRPMTQMVMYSVARRQIWRVGDAHFALDGVPDYGETEKDRVTCAIHKAWTDALLRTGHSVDEIRATDPGFTAMFPLFALEGAWVNRPGSRFSFGTINGEPVPGEYIEVVDASGAAVVTLASDGYLDVSGDLDAAEHLLAGTLESDPLLQNTGTNRVWKAGFASFDDRAWVRFRA